VKLDTLDALKDDELEAVIERAQGLLQKRDEERKAKALADAAATLAAVGLTLKDLFNGKGRKATNSHTYHDGHRYQHPTDKTLIWKGHGQKPNWLRELEAQGGKAVEIGTAAI
jgi:DNA-binding protein H-NS